MKRYLLARAGFALVSLVLLSVTIFAFVRLTGDPAVLLTEPGASPEDLVLIRQQFGLDRPLWVQYGSFVAHLARGDFGQSFYYRTDVLDLYLSRLPASLLLAAVAMAFSLVIGIPTGVIAAVRVNGWWDSAGKIFALLGLSLPSFWVGLLLILFFSVFLGWLPSSGSGSLLHVLMPAFALGWYFAAAHMRLTRSSMLEVIRQDYVRTARAKGLAERRVVIRHALRNAAIPIVTHVMANLPALLIGAFLIERFFSIPGIGREVILDVERSDFPVIKAITVYVAAATMLFNLLADLMYKAIDPRVQLK